MKSGGDLITEALRRQGVRFFFALCGGHISPILVSAQLGGIRVIDVRHEATAVFAADATARLTGVPGVAVVTAGPGATNTITAVKNAQLAQSPVVLLGGATATLLKGRGALQDIDQMALFRPHVKEAIAVRRLRDLVPSLDRAFAVAASGVPGPVFVECPVDLLYDEGVVRQWYVAKAAGAGSRGLRDAVLDWYIHRHLERLFAGVDGALPPRRVPDPAPAPAPGTVAKAAALLARAERPVLVIGSQALLSPGDTLALADAVGVLGVPVYLSGMARGLLGPDHPLQLRHRRKEALREADLVILAGTPCDFRLDYGRHISSRAHVVSANRSRDDLTRNRKPQLGVLAAPDLFLRALARASPGPRPAVESWIEGLRARDESREAEIRTLADAHSDGVNPLRLCRAIDKALAPDSVVVADGGDFVSTASYIVRPRGPLSWLDPGAFGTLGVGAGFALGAKLCRPEADVWILYGDGSAGYTLSEFDTFVRHGLNVIAVVGNDAAWSQIAREQVELLKDDVGTVLRPTDYHRVAEGFGARGLQISGPEDAHSVLALARGLARQGSPVLVNALIGKTDFRKGSISM
jgi:thiamine pyrophosphate-dependent acetolactate synthase large subunit-like protein